MGRTYYRLAGNKGTTIPRKFIIYDTETSAQKLSQHRELHTLKLGVACEYRRKHSHNPERVTWKTFTSVGEFWDWVCGRCYQSEKVHLLAHNQHFDAAVVNLFTELAQRGWTMNKPIVDSNLFMVKFTKEKKTLQVLDTFNWWKFSVKAMGEMLELPKLDVDFDSCSTSELEVYCKRDVEVLLEMLRTWIHFLEVHDLGRFKYTIASQALQAYRHRFMNTDINIHRENAAIELEIAAYKGGRTEAFVIGELRQPILDYDVNSLYPAVMVKHPYPNRLIRHYDNPSLKLLENSIDLYLCIAHVKVRVDYPVVAKRGRRLCFPVGEFWTTLCSPELEYVKKHGDILACTELNTYEGAYLFRDYVNYFYDLKRRYGEKDNRIFYTLTKLFLNSLYGKFGQRNYDILEIGDCDPTEVASERIYSVETGERYTRYKFGGKVWRNVRTRTLSHHSFPAIAAFVTAYARMLMLGLIEQVGWNNVFYMDTDSLFVNEKGRESLANDLHEYELGKLKLEGEGSYLAIHGVKDYVLDDVRKLKGVRKDAKQIGPNTYLTTQFLNTKSLLQRGDLSGPIVQEVEKHLTRKYYKGVVTPSGWVRPFWLPHEQERLED
jgi:hypothetical protein